MKQERKEALLKRFPAIPAGIMKSMEGKGAANFAVFLTNGNELFARCFHRYSRGKVIIERQRYVFAKDGCVRYGKDDGESWTIRKEFREPVFYQCCSGFNMDNSYSLLNIDAVKESCMKYSCVGMYIDDCRGGLIFEYLRIYCRHRNLEYLMKAGYGPFAVVEGCNGYWGGQCYLHENPEINWKSNDLLKMLGISRSEFKALEGQEKLFSKYKIYREIYPDYSPGELIMMAKVYGYSRNVPKQLSEKAGLKPRRITQYLYSNDISPNCYRDHVEHCLKLGYDLSDTAISLPHNFEAMHERTSEALRLIEMERLAKDNQRSEKEYCCTLYAEYTARFEYRSGKYEIVVPRGAWDIVREGADQHNCVAGYAERHLKGRTIILFLRKKEFPGLSFGTLEIGGTKGGYYFKQAFAAGNKQLPADAKKWLDKWLNMVNS
ncbi:MAG: PcfJ domain-containing protein, partial [Oscillospiraceae bacterium]|nr:PcfJ domain-containing protein [Oscillospiraceae bacterium]